MSLDVELIIKKQSCKYCGHQEESETVFESNITHNLAEMAQHAELYYPLWRPEELKIDEACKLVPFIKRGLEELKKRPDFYKKFDAPNGWGKYVDFVPWLERYLAACIKYPNAKVWVSR